MLTNASTPHDDVTWQRLSAVYDFILSFPRADEERQKTEQPARRKKAA